MKYTTSFIVFPKHCNHFKEIIFGGAFMAELDLAAAHCVRKALAGSISKIENAVTHKAEFEFKLPSYVGDVLDLEATLSDVGKKSLTIKVIATRGNDVIAVANFVFITIGSIQSLDEHPRLLPYREHEEIIQAQTAFASWFA